MGGGTLGGKGQLGVIEHAADYVVARRIPVGLHLLHLRGFLRGGGLHRQFGQLIDNAVHARHLSGGNVKRGHSAIG